MQYITVKSDLRESFIDITPQVERFISSNGYKDGVLYLFVPHTTAAITINENADPSVQSDINNFLRKLIPRDSNFKHLEGNADAHIKSSIIGCELFVLVENSKILLGTWQGIYFCEFDGPRSRKVYMRFLD
ncbi:MAG: secondary thiamine-phosphate synthase enzyme YjbQ [Deferribacterota bacterium]|nr:secondary thiamine-phosphate synthase enzyme YjbQ [Deferribacterota bacterium]